MSLLFNKYNKNTSYVWVSGVSYEVDSNVLKYVIELEKKNNELENELIGTKAELISKDEELKLIKPILNDENLSPAVSLGCGKCEYVVRSPWNGQILGCRRKSVCEDFIRRE